MSEAEKNNKQEDSSVVLVRWQDFFGPITKESESDKNESEEACQAVGENRQLEIAAAPLDDEPVLEVEELSNPTGRMVAAVGQGRAPSILNLTPKNETKTVIMAQRNFVLNTFQRRVIWSGPGRIGLPYDDS